MSNEPVTVITPEMLALIAGAVLSLLMSYIPGLNVAYASLKPEVKRLIMAGLLLVVAGAIFAGNCTGWFPTGGSCDKAGILSLATIYILALVANQGAYEITVLPTQVRDAAAVAKRLTA